MNKVIAGMTMSLDWFINDKNGSAESLSPDFSEMINSDFMKEQIQNTGAVIMGNNVYHMADPFLWVTDEYEFQVPLFILTHEVPEKKPEGNDKLSVNFVTDGIKSAIDQAKIAAGDKDVLIIGGASTIQQALNSGLCEELQIDLMPVLLGEGLKLFENIQSEKIKLERLKVIETTPMRTTIVFKVTSTN